MTPRISQDYCSAAGAGHAHREVPIERVTPPTDPASMRARIRAAGDMVARMAAEQHVAILRATTPLGDRSDPLNADKGPHLRDSWRSVRERQGAYRVVALRHWPYPMEHGASPHTIRPRGSRRFLRFRSRRTGGIVFAKEVRHPGYPPTRKVSNSARDVLADVVVTTRRVLGGTIRRGR